MLIKVFFFFFPPPPHFWKSADKPHTPMYAMQYSCIFPCSTVLKYCSKSLFLPGEVNTIKSIIICGCEVRRCVPFRVWTSVCLKGKKVNILYCGLVYRDICYLPIL